jgi:diguanylate cyclase (GGDEF)-like protein
MAVMLRVYTCLTQEHDPLALGLAVLICILGAGVTVALLRRAAGTMALSRAGWLLLCGVAGGAFVWCTHFIAMLAYQPAAGLAFGLLPTLVSLLAAMLGCGAGAALATSRLPRAPLAGGAVLGLSVGVMHYAGMAALGQDGDVRFAPGYVVASLLLGAGCGALALRAALAGSDQSGTPPARRAAVGGTLWLGLAILSLHLTGMAGVSVTVLQPTTRGVSGPELALAVAAVGALVLAAAAAAWMIDNRTRAESGSHLRQLADSALEGLAVLRDGRLVEANDTLTRMLGRDRAALLGLPLPGDLLALRDAPPGETTAHGTAAGRLRHADGSLLEVEVVIRHDVPAPGMSVFAFRDLRERREQERRILHLAVHDPLTGLPNRARFAQRMDQTLARAARQQPAPCFAMLHIGLDHFQEINDLHGHRGGDALLHGVGRRLAQALPAQAFAARLGSDEFGILLPYGEAVEVFELLTRLERALAEPSYIGGAEVTVGASTGVALFPDDAASAEQLRAHADLAMRRAKAGPGRGLRFYQAEMDAVERQRRRMRDELRLALAQEQLFLACQVQVDVRSGAPCGHEMLLRWQHPERGLVGPAEFIPVAEESGLIQPIGEWVLRRACAMAAANPALGKVAVNLSAVQFSQPDLPQQVASALAESGLPPARLELEITETMLMQDRARTLALLERIKALGVKVAMDDFGTGYSSLGTLRAFPFDKIKLDRSFMAEIDTSPQAMAILRAVIGIGRALEIPVLAEGVETETQLALLRDEGCDEVQGYLFGRPGAPPAAAGRNGWLAA